MNQFIYDMIHMTEGEKLINYWWLWLLMTIPALIYVCWWRRRKKKQDWTPEDLIKVIKELEQSKSKGEVK